MCALGFQAFWFHNSTFYASEISAALEDPDTFVQRRCAEEIYPGTFLPVQRTIEYSNFRISGSGNETSALARAYTMRYFLLGIFEGSTDEIMEFEKLILDLINNDFAFGGIDVHIQAQRSFDDELEASVGNDIFLMAIAFTVMIIFCSLTLGKPLDKLYGRALLANADVFVILFAGGAGYGLMLYVGIPVSTSHAISRFPKR